MIQTDGNGNIMSRDDDASMEAVDTEIDGAVAEIWIRTDSDGFSYGRGEVAVVPLSFEAFMRLFASMMPIAAEIMANGIDYVEEAVN